VGNVNQKAIVEIRAMAVPSCLTMNEIAPMEIAEVGAASNR